jgi:putative transposase
MKKQRLTETQIVSILKQYDGGRDPIELCREYGISKATLYNWRKKYAGMDAANLKEKGFAGREPAVKADVCGANAGSSACQKDH